MTDLSPRPLPQTIDETLKLLSDAGYVADRALSTVLFLSLRMQRPLFLEGEAGVGKTEIAKVLADRLGRRLIRLQCYEGLDVSSAVYEWNYAAQMIEIRMEEAAGSVDRSEMEKNVFSEKIPDPPPRHGGAHRHEGRGPRLPHRRARPHRRGFRGFPARNPLRLPGHRARTRHESRRKSRPSSSSPTNRTREIHDALKRRCLYHWVDYPNAARELEIRAPQGATRQ